MPSIETFALIAIAALVVTVAGAGFIPAIIYGGLYKITSVPGGVPLVDSSSSSGAVIKSLVSNNAYAWQDNAGQVSMLAVPPLSTGTYSILSSAPTFTLFTPSTSYHRITDVGSDGTYLWKKFDMMLTFSFNMTSTGTFANIAIPDDFPTTAFTLNSPRGVISCVRGGVYAKEYSVQLRTGSGFIPPYLAFVYSAAASDTNVGTCSLSYNMFLRYQLPAA